MGAAPARSGTGPGVPDINPLAANILSTLLNPGAGAALANSMAMLQNPGPSGGKIYSFISIIGIKGLNLPALGKSQHYHFSRTSHFITLNY